MYNISITLDPTVWIFDDRRIDLKTFFTESYVEKDEMEEYKREMGNIGPVKLWKAQLSHLLWKPKKNLKNKRYYGNLRDSFTSLFEKSQCQMKMQKHYLSKHQTAKIIHFHLTKLDDIILQI